MCGVSNMERVFVVETDVGPFKRGHVVLLDDTDSVGAGWINTGYFQEIKEPAGGDEGADRAR